MTLSAQTTRYLYSGNGSTVDFTIPFEYFDTTSFIKVYLRNNSAGTETLQSYSTHYTINTSTDVLTMGTAPPSGYSLLIRLNMTLSQVKDYITNGAFLQEDHEDGLDRIVAMVQYLSEEIDRSAKMLNSSSASGPKLPELSGQAATLLIVNDAEDGYDTGISYADFLADVATVASDVSLASASASSASSSSSSASSSASSAANSAVAASASATAAAVSAAAAAADSAGVSTDAAAAVAAAAAASASQTAAASSASSASTSASAASTSASNASTSATSASNSATSATSSKNAAATSETNAAASAASAAASASAVGTFAQETPSGTVNGSNTAFTLAHTPLSSTSVRVYKNGVFQRQTTYYSVSSATITFVTAPTTGDEIDALYNY
jgi:hypothetical protein